VERQVGVDRNDVFGEALGDLYVYSTEALVVLGMISATTSQCKLCERRTYSEDVLLSCDHRLRNPHRVGASIKLDLLHARSVSLRVRIVGRSTGEARPAATTHLDRIRTSSDLSRLD